MKKKAVVASLASLVLVGSIGATVFASSYNAQDDKKPGQAVSDKNNKNDKKDKKDKNHKHDKDVVKSDSLFQYSTINALMSGIFDGDITLNEVAEHGDLGLGTLNGVDGELTILDNKFYRFDNEGVMSEVSGDTQSPFVVSTNFDIDKTATITNVTNATDLSEKLLAQLDNKNNFYAFKMPVTLTYLKTRSEAKQERPYPLLKDVLANQSEFEYKNVKGTFVGFYTPNYAATINVPGFHFHFISDDKTLGGHILNLAFDKANVQIDSISEFKVELPQSAEFANADLTKIELQDVIDVEGDHK